MKYILLTEKHWHRPLFEKLRNEIEAEWKLIDRKDDLTEDQVASFNPDRIFIPHWSYLIPSGIYKNYECIVFHMTDLPYGRGGSPLQNLIERGHTETKISALRVEKELDAGKIYLKKALTLHGTAREIFLRSSVIIGEMILEIHHSNIEPAEQSGDVVTFKRRTAEQSNLNGITDIMRVYDHIRMLDCEGYPPAFIETENFRFEFTRPAFNDAQTLIADVRIIKK